MNFSKIQEKIDELLDSHYRTILIIIGIVFLSSIIGYNLTIDDYNAASIDTTYTDKEVIESSEIDEMKQKYSSEQCEYDRVNESYNCIEKSFLNSILNTLILISGISLAGIFFYESYRKENKCIFEGCDNEANNPDYDIICDYHYEKYVEDSDDMNKE